MFRFLNRPAAVAVSTLAAGLAVVGCNSSGETHTSKADTSSPAVQASTITHVPEQNQTYTLNFPTNDPSTSVLRVEQVTPKEVRAGEQFSYQVRVTNLTDRPLQSVILRASQPEGFRVANADKNGPSTQPAANGWSSYDVGNLGPKESRVFTMSGVPTQQGVIRQTYDVTYQQQMATAVNVTAPAIQVTKQGPSEVDICKPIDWTYSVQNTGSGVARHVTLNDTLPEGLTTQDGQNKVAADLGDIPAGQTRQVVAHLKAARAGKFASAATANSDAGNAKSDSVTTTARQPKLDLAIKGPDKEFLGKPVTYQVTVTNSGDAPARQAVIRFNAPETAQLMNVNAEGAQTQQAAGRLGNGESLGTIDPGQSRTINVAFQPNQGGTIHIDANATAECVDRVSQSVDTMIQTLPALLLETVDAKDPVRVGDNVIYRIRVTNQGNGPDSNVKVTATIPEGEQFVDATGSTRASNSGQSITFEPVATLAPKQSATWDVTVKALKASDVQFKVSAQSDAVKAPAEKTEPTKLY